MNLTRTISRFDAHHRLFWAVVAAGAAYWGMPGTLAQGTRIVIAWNLYALTEVLLLWIVAANDNPREVRRSVTLQDASRTVLFVVVVAGACASIGAVAFLLGGLKSASGDIMAGHVMLTLSTIVVSWLMMHAIFAVRYAHHYYRPGGNGTTGKNHAGGLIFPEEPEPDYVDFMYFSLVIGMTCQVSDVQVSSRHIRRIVLVHGVLSFAFNTIVLALTINILSGLLL
jgi:uncharacterized membrane protein